MNLRFFRYNLGKFNIISSRINIMRWSIFGEMFYITQFFINSVIDLMTSKISHVIKLLLLVKNDLDL